MSAGFIAAATFLLLTGTGAAAQVYKLARRTADFQAGNLPRDRIYEGLLPVREMWSLAAFLLFALSGLTRTYLDVFLVVSRTPVIVLSTVIMWYLYRHGARGAARFFRIAVGADIFLCSVIALRALGFDLSASLLPRLVDGALAVVGVLLLYGKLTQARAMHRERRSRAVSWLREGGLVIKDLTGLWYAWSVGSELLLVGITHAFSVVSSAAICTVKFQVERRPA